jgi:hypothetical protein
MIATRRDLSRIDTFKSINLDITIDNFVPTKIKGRTLEILTI